MSDVYDQVLATLLPEAAEEQPVGIVAQMVPDYILSSTSGTITVMAGTGWSDISVSYSPNVPVTYLGSVL